MQAAALERGGEVAGVVARSGSRRAACLVVNVPDLGHRDLELGRGSPAARPRGPRRRGRPRRSAGRTAPRSGSPPAAAATRGTARRRTRSPARRSGPRPSRGRVRPRRPGRSSRAGSGCRAAACRSPTRRGPWSRPGPRSTAGAAAAARWRAASAFASSVLPTPAGPSIRSGLSSRVTQEDGGRQAGVGDVALRRPAPRRPRRRIRTATRVLLIARGRPRWGAPSG